MIIIIKGVQVIKAVKVVTIIIIIIIKGVKVIKVVKDYLTQSRSSALGTIAWSLPTCLSPWPAGEADTGRVSLNLKEIKGIKEMK